MVILAAAFPTSPTLRFTGLAVGGSYPRSHDPSNGAGRGILVAARGMGVGGAGYGGENDESRGGFWGIVGKETCHANSA